MIMKTFKLKELVCYMVWDKVNKVYVESCSKRCWFNKSGAMACARYHKGRINFEIHKFNMVLDGKTNLEPIFVLGEL